MRIHAIFGGIGAFAVKFRWVVIAAWLIAAFAVPHYLPSLNSVTQGNNSAFLPASAPSEKAAQLAAPFGGTNLTPVPVVAAVSQGTLTAADAAWLTTLQHDLGTVPTVVTVHDLGRSADGQAEQLQVLSNVGGGDQAGQTTLINDLRAEIAKAAPPSGLQVHLAGDIAINVDQQAKSGTTGNQVEVVAALFILVLLLLIFRSLLAPLITLIPAFFAVAISGPLVGEAAHAGLKVSQLAQLLLIVLVLGAGTDYGLFLVFRVRENLRDGADPKDAVRSAVTRVGETITFSALTVIAALLSLLVATFQIYSELGIPLAIGIGTVLLAGLTLLPALLAVFGRAAFWPSKTREGTGKTGLWGRVATRIVRRPAIPLTIGVVVFGALALAVTAYRAGRVRRLYHRAGRNRLRGGYRPAHRALPGECGQPDQPGLQTASAGLERYVRNRHRDQSAHRERAVHRGHRAAEPGRGHPDAGSVPGVARNAGQSRRRCPPCPRATSASRWSSMRPTGPPRSTSAPTARRSSSRPA